MPLSADARTQVCVPGPLAPLVSSSSPEAAHLSAAPFHFIPLQPLHPPPPAQRTAAGLLCFRHSGIVYSENRILLLAFGGFFPPPTPPKKNPSR